MRFNVIVIGQGAARQMVRFEVGRPPSLRTGWIHAKRALRTSLDTLRSSEEREMPAVGDPVQRLLSNSAPALMGEWDYYTMPEGYFPLIPGRRKDYLTGAPPGVGFGDHTGSNPNLDAVLGEHPKVDVIRVGDLDFERAREEERLALSEQFAQWMAVVDRVGRPTPASEMVPPDAHINAEPWRRYRAQPAIEEASDALPYRRECLVEFYGYELQTFLHRRADRYPLTPWAVVHDGRWLANEMDGQPLMSDEDWSQFVDRLLNDLSRDTLLTAFACHG